MEEMDVPDRIQEEIERTGRVRAAVTARIAKLERELPAALKELDRQRESLALLDAE